MAANLRDPEPRIDGLIRRSSDHVVHARGAAAVELRARGHARSERGTATCDVNPLYDTES